MQTSGQFGVPHQAGGEVPQFLSRAQTHHMFNLSTSDMGTLSPPSNSTSHAPHHLHPHLNPTQPQAQAQSQAQSSAGPPGQHHHHHQQELPHTHHPLDLLPHTQHPNHHHFHNHQLFSQSQIGLAAQIKHQDGASIQQAHVPQPQQQQHQHQQQQQQQQQHQHVNSSVHLQHHHQQSTLQNPSSHASPAAPHPSTAATAPQLLPAHPSPSANANAHNTHGPNPNHDSNPSPNLNSIFNPISHSNTITNANLSKVDTAAPPPIMAQTQPGPAIQANAIANMNVAAAREESYDGDEQEVLGEEGEVKGGGAAGSGGGGSRWPRQEALALLKVRSEMDSMFRDSSLKGPLWEAVSRKLADLGYHRSAKKCKEKFENVHKYYKRTKEGRAGRQDGKSYRFFSQLEALYGKTVEENASMSNAFVKDMSSPRGIMLLQQQQQTSTTSYLHHSNPPDMPVEVGVAVPHVAPPTISRETLPPFVAPHPRDNALQLKLDSDHSSSELNFSSDSSDNDDYDDDVENDDNGNIDSTATKEHITTPSHGRKRKRKALLLSKKYLAFFENVMKRLLQKQEQMQQKFLEALERRDQDRMIREEAWKRQEMTRLSREHDLRTQERALAASRDAALIAFLQKITGQSSIQLPASQTAIQAQPLSISPFDMKEDYQHDNEYYDPNSKRWPKPEVNALIKLRTALDQRFHEPGSKSQLWEEISAAMASQGFNRSAKRCREKWENINKYFKKAKESNKKRPENAKTCPYYHQLDALYREGVLGSPYSSKQLLLLEKGEEERSGNLNVNVPHHPKEEGESQGTQGGVPLTAETLVAKATKNNEGAEVNHASAATNPSKGTHALPLFMSSENSEAGVKHVNQAQPIDAPTVSPPNGTSSSLPHMLEREQTLDRSLVEGTINSSSADNPQQKDLQFGSMMQ